MIYNIDCCLSVRPVSKFNPSLKDVIYKENKSEE